MNREKCRRETTEALDIYMLKPKPNALRVVESNQRKINLLMEEKMDTLFLYQQECMMKLFNTLQTGVEKPKPGNADNTRQ